MKRNLFKTPAHVILFSIIITIVLGTLLLALPMARYTEIALIDLFFTATSATCVTGLQTVSLGSFTLFGKLVILALIQIGGLGLITLSLFLLSLFTDVGLATQFIAGKVLEVDTWKKGKRILAFIIATTAIAELIGAILIFFCIKNNYQFEQALFYSFFHAISSFTNSGFTLFEGGMWPFADNMPFLIITGILVFLGGFGFISLYELFLYYQHKKQFLSLQTKIISVTTLVIILVSALLFLLLEHGHLSPQNNFLHSIIDALFNAVSCRNAGLTTFDIALLHKATLFLILIIAFIGAAPGSSGSGIKVTTFAIFLATLRSVIHGSLSVHIRSREIPHDLVLKSFCVITLSISWLAIILFCLLIIEPQFGFFPLLFELVSAFTTLGMSLGITTKLAFLSKILLIISMFIGRVGSLTLILALRKQHKPEFHYPEERVMIS